MSPLPRCLTATLAAVLCVTAAAASGATPVSFTVKSDSVQANDEDTSGSAGSANAWTVVDAWSTADEEFQGTPHPDPEPVPLPPSIWLIATGLAAVGGARLIRRLR
jgi:hypothetical protein